MWLNTNRIVWILGLTVAVAAVVQVGLDANPLVLLLALVSIACSLYTFWLFGVFNLAGWVSLAYIGGTVLIAFIAKTAFLQPVDSNLVAPLSSFFVQAVCCLALLTASIVAHWIGVGRPLTPPITDLTTLRLMSVWCMAIGWAINLITIFIGRTGDASYGGLNVFGSLIYLGIICRAALVMLRSDGRRVLDPLLIAALIASTISGFLSTGKGEMAFPWVALFMAILFFKGKLPRRFVVLLACGVMLFLIVAPITIAFRYMGLRNMPIDKEIETFETMLPNLLNADALAHLTANPTMGGKSLHYDYYGGHRGQLILGRFSSIQQIDPIIAAVDERGPMGDKIIIDSFRFVLPKFIDPDKPTEVQGLTVIKEMGLYRGGGSRPTVPLAAIVYAAYGMAGVIVIPFLTFLCYLLLLKKFSWDVRGNVFSIFLLMSVLTVNGSELKHFIATIFRDLPLLCVAVLLMQKLVIYLTLRQREFGPGMSGAD